MENFLLLFFIALTFMLFALLAKGLENLWTAIKGVPGVSLPLHKRFQRWILLAFNSRDLYKFEAGFNFNPGTKQVQIPFYIARIPIAFDIEITNPGMLAPSEVRYRSKDEWHTCDFGVKYRKKNNIFRVRIFPARMIPMKEVLVTFPHLDDDYLSSLNVKLTRKTYPDVNLFLTGLAAAEDGRTDEALDLFQQYRKHSDDNPWLFRELSELHKKLKRYEEVEECTLRAALTGCWNWGSEAYRVVQGEIPYHDIETIERFRENGGKWKLNNPRGVVALDVRQDFLLGLHEWYLKKYREVLEIRRPVAARRLTAVSFPFDTGQCLLYSNLRVVHPDNSVDEVPDEHFSVQDSSERVTHREKTGVWVLPDLSVGDILEWSYHILAREDIRVNDRPHFFIATLPQDEFYPTLNGTVNFKYPVDWKLKFVTRNEPPTLERTSISDGERQKDTFRIVKYTPTWGTGFFYDMYRFNPSIACGWKSHEWDEVIGAVLQHQFGDMEAEDEIPAPLAEVLEIYREPVEALQHGFYWVRDKLKYRPFDRSELVSAHAGWAGEIVQSGVANCREKTYLLYKLCRKLGVKAELVVIPSDRGLIYEDLPSNQFNHVFLRAEVDGIWKYLDATYYGAPFCSPPDGCQGLRALVLEGEGQIITVPEVEPERNRIVISETFDQLDGDWLTGRFELRAEGNIARIKDEYWKGLSIHRQGLRHSAQEALRGSLPDMVLRDYKRTSNTAHSDVLAVSGHHKRCHLSTFRDRLVGIIEWKAGALALDYWEALHPAELFVFPMPMQVEINFTLSGSLHEMLIDISRKIGFENAYCSISEEREKQGERLSLRRKISIKRRFIGGDDLRQLPRTMEQLEKALQIAVAFSNG